MKNIYFSTHASSLKTIQKGGTPFSIPVEVHKKFEYKRENLPFFQAMRKDIERENAYYRQNKSILPHLQDDPWLKTGGPVIKKKPFKGRKLLLARTWLPRMYIRYNAKKKPTWFSRFRDMAKKYATHLFWLKTEHYPYKEFQFRNLSHGKLKLRNFRPFFKKTPIFFFTFFKKITKMAINNEKTINWRLAKQNKPIRKASVFFKHSNSKKGIAYYKTMLRIFRIKQLNFFLRYKTIIVPLLRKRLNIYKKKSRVKKPKRLSKFFGFRHALKMFKTKTLVLRQKQYKIFVLIKQGLRFLLGGLSNNNLFFLFKNAQRNKKTNKFLTFYFNFFRNLATSLLLTCFIPRMLNAQQFIKNNFIVVNGRICQNIMYLLKPYDIVEIHRFMFLLFFVRGKTAPYYRKNLYNRLTYNPFYISNYRVLLSLFVRSFRRGDHLSTFNSTKIKGLERLPLFAFFYRNFINFFSI